MTSVETKPAVQAAAVTQRPYHDAIDLSGRLSVRYQQNGSEQALHGNFTWMQRANQTIVTLLSPLGQTIATIEVTPNASTLIQAGQAPRTAADVDALAAGALGWPLPISGLRDWLQGFALDKHGRRFIAAPHTTDSASVTSQEGWRIHYASWQGDDVPPSGDRPKRIDLERSTAEAGDVAIRIVIDTWRRAD